MKRMVHQNQQLRAVVENQNNFTFLVNRQFEVQTTNLTFPNQASDAEPNVLGNVLHCKNAHHVGRCGEAEACHSCPLRFVITKSFERERDFSGVDACMEVYNRNEELVDMDVQVEGHFVKVDNEDHMVINVKDETMNRIGSLPKVLLITEDMALYDRIRTMLSNEFRVLGADNDHQAFHRLQMASDYKFQAVMTDMKFFSKNKDVIKLMAGNNHLPLFVLTSGDVEAAKNEIHFISEQIEKTNLTKLLLSH